MAFNTLKEEFIVVWNAASVWNAAKIDDVPEDLFELRGASEVALEMFQAGQVFWEHYGWAQSLASGICVAGMGKSVCQSISQQVLAAAPAGFEAVFPRIKRQAQGDFSDHDSLEATVARTLPGWLERLSQNKEERSGAIAESIAKLNAAFS